MVLAAAGTEYGCGREEMAMTGGADIDRMGTSVRRVCS
jgi:hypothetical protein